MKGPATRGCEAVEAIGDLSAPRCPANHNKLSLAMQFTCVTLHHTTEFTHPTPITPSTLSTPTPTPTPQNKVLFGQEMRVNWAFQSHQREDTSNHWHVFIGDLGQVGARGAAGCMGARARARAPMLPRLEHVPRQPPLNRRSTSSQPRPSPPYQDVTDAVLFAAFSQLPGCSDARVMWDHATGRSKGYGFVAMQTREEAQSAIDKMHGQVGGLDGGESR